MKVQSVTLHLPLKKKQDGYTVYLFPTFFPTIVFFSKKNYSLIKILSQFLFIDAILQEKIAKS
ncbi:MAG: hypothetical protein D3905_00125 [Candidatus Electrothrix sp. AS4_5]|nr:hypothetical protein [Candidatus Electrothrix gigas]